MITALFNAQSAILGALIGSVIMVFLCEAFAVKPRDEVIKEHKMLIAECEAPLPRNQSCELTAKVKN